MTHLIRNLVLFAFCSSSAIGKAQVQDVFISEYVEATGLNKAIEIYNGTAGTIDLGLGQYAIDVYYNGATTASSFALSGTIASGSTKVIAHPNAILGISPDFTTTVLNFNGNDAVVLRKNGATGPVIDVIGQVGFNPGSQWGANDTCTLDRTLRRKNFVCQGDPTTTNAFYVSTQWVGFPLSTFTGLGTHSTTCSAGSTSTLFLSPTTLSYTSILNVSSVPQQITLVTYSLNANTTVSVAAPFSISQNSLGPFTASLTLPTASINYTTLVLYAIYTPSNVSAANVTLSALSGSIFSSMVLSGTCSSITPIPIIQGTTTASSFTNQIVVTEGIVTGDFQNTNQLQGFFIQDTLGDNNSLSSDAVFVSNTSFSVNVGDYIRLSASVEEYFDRTQLHAVSIATVIGSGYSLVPTTFTLPAFNFEAFENMLVTNSQTLTVNDVYNLARYGEVVLSKDRNVTPSNHIDPNDALASGTNFSGNSNVNAIIAQQQLNAQNKIILDDASSVQNPSTVPYLDPGSNTLRCGSTITTLTGVLDFAFSNYRLQPLQTPVISYAIRPSVPTVGNFNVKIAGLNVLNYFNGNGSGGGFPTSRGASTALEFSRQRAKLFEAVKAIDADVLGLMEMENDGDSNLSAIADFVLGLNNVLGASTYTYIVDPTTANGGTGTDEIKVALIYKPAQVTPIGAAIADSAAIFDRHPLAQCFQLNTNGEKFSVIVNHFKSKSCSAASAQDLDQNDGQSCYNSKRRLQALQLQTFSDTVKFKSQDQDLVLLGDFNAYGEEDPLDVLRSFGWQHLLPSSYSYVFDGQVGSLDHLFVSPTLSAAITGAAKWHINSDEPIAKDYNQEFNPTYLYSADAYRCSDHDPVMLGLRLEAPLLNASPELFSQQQVSVYPSPGVHGNQLTITSKLAFTQLTIYDLDGKCLKEISVEKPIFIYTLSIENYSKGDYILLVGSPGLKSYTKRIQIR